MPKWPLQSECNAFYGNPRGRDGGHVNEKWYSENIVLIRLPFEMRMGDIRITRISIHQHCAASLARVLAVMLDERYKDPTFSPFDLNYDGSFCYRSMRTASTLSMHAYGCAIDIDAVHNPLGKKGSRLKAMSAWVKAFEAEDWIWGGRWSRPDAMHFQAARISG
jgi:hypothetical protein